MGKRKIEEEILGRTKAEGGKRELQRNLIEGELFTLKRKIDTQRRAFIDFKESRREVEEEAEEEEEGRKWRKF